MAAKSDDPAEIIKRIVQLTERDGEESAAAELERSIQHEAHEKFRRLFFKNIVYFFLLLSSLSFLLVVSTSVFETYQVNAGIIKPADRVVDGKVFIALIAGTVTQLATIVLVMVKWLFDSDKK